MALRKGDHDVQTMLMETIMALCRNILPYKGEFSVEGLLGITMDNQEIVLVNVNQTVKRPGTVKRKLVHEFDNIVPNDKRNESPDSSHENHTDETSSSSISRKKRKRHKAKRKRSTECLKNEEFSGAGDISDSDDGNDSFSFDGTVPLKPDEIKLEKGVDMNCGQLEIESPGNFSYGPTAFPGLEYPGTESLDCDNSRGTTQQENHIESSPMKGNVRDSAEDVCRNDMKPDDLAALCETNNGQTSTINVSSPTVPSMFVNGPTSFHHTFNFPPAALPILSAMQMHSPARERPYHCPQCDKSFTQKVHLKTHLRIHTGEKPFRCQLCGKCFNQSNNLKRHLSTHDHNAV